MNEQNSRWDLVIAVIDNIVKFVLVCSLMHFFTNVEQIKSILNDILIELSRNNGVG